MNLARSQPVARLFALGLSIVLGACGSVVGTANNYPALRDIPAAPTVTPQADRDRLKQELDQERSNALSGAQTSPSDSSSSVTAPSATGGKQPAVPPKKPPAPVPHAQLEDLKDACGGPIERAIELAQAIPSLRGTLHDGSPGSSAEGEGITGAVGSHSPLTVPFEPGSAELSREAVAGLEVQAEKFAARDRGTFFVDARGGRTGNLPIGTVGSLESFSLGLKRASAIANFLISLGVPADRIKLMVPGDRSLAVSREVRDVAMVSFEP